MNHIIKSLILKDIQLNYRALCIYLIISFISLWMLTSTKLGMFNAGAVIILSMVIITGIHMITTTISNERNDQVLPFIMSLPITFLQYTHAKICANLGLFLLYWLLIVSGIMWVIFSQPHVPDGMAIFALILLLEMLVVFTLLLAVSLISESQVWTVVVMSITNIGLSLFMFWLSGFKAINSYMQTEEVVWNKTAVTFVSVELFLIMTFLILIYWVQAQKKDFL